VTQLTVVSLDEEINQRLYELEGLSIEFNETIPDDTINCDKPGGQLELPVMELDDKINCDAP